MPEFETYIDIDPWDFVSSCGKREIEELIDALEEQGKVKRTYQKGGNPSDEKPSLMEIEWNEMIYKLSSLRQRLSHEEEEILKEIVGKYS
jgi:hypothetical protein